MAPLQIHAQQAQPLQPWLKDVASALVASKASISTAHHMLSIMLSDPLTSTLWRRTRPTHFGGYAELDVHNMFGFMEEKTTHLAVQSIIPGKCPFLISRSTFLSAGKWTGH
ncbi:hypothetical protein C8R48DRAFT_776541 [Suillus tomentosus]|nr:hypothetical protein C8R48DRAFT_776541 [Suillus tomentosus]